MVLNFISLNQPSNRFLSNLETIALTLHEKSKSFSNFAWLFFHNHGTILNLQPIGTWRIQFSIQCYGFIHERTVSSNHIQNWNLEILLILKRAQFSIDAPQRGQKILKSPGKKLVKSNKSISWNCIFGKNWFLAVFEIAKNGIWSKKL